MCSYLFSIFKYTCTFALGSLIFIGININYHLSFTGAGYTFDILEGLAFSAVAQLFIILQKKPLL